MPCDLDIGWFGHVSINETRRHQADKLRHATRHEFSDARDVPRPISRSNYKRGRGYLAQDSALTHSRIRVVGCSVDPLNLDTCTDRIADQELR